MGNASHNSLSPFGLDFGALNRLNEAGLIIADYNSRCGMSTPVNLAGATYDLVLNPMSPELREAKVKEIGEKLQTVEGVAFTRAGGELRQIVALRLNPEYFNRLQQSFGEIGAALVAGS